MPEVGLPVKGGNLEYNAGILRRGEVPDAIRLALTYTSLNSLVLIYVTNLALTYARAIIGSQKMRGSPQTRLTGKPSPRLLKLQNLSKRKA